MKKIFVSTIIAMMAMVCSENIATAAETQGQAAEISNVAQKKEKKNKKETKVLKLSANIHCKDCAKKIQENIGFEKGVVGLEVSVEERTATITYNPAKTDVVTLLAAMRKIGFPATIIEQ